MAKAMVETLVDDLDGSPAVDTVRLGWNGHWRELDLSKRNAAALARVLDRYWEAGRAVQANGPASRHRRRAASRTTKSGRDPKMIRTWAVANGIAVPARGRVPAAVERQYNEANHTS
jgi:nucleoid-associated protein Lsr2